MHWAAEAGDISIVFPVCPEHLSGIGITKDLRRKLLSERILVAEPRWHAHAPHWHGAFSLAVDEVVMVFIRSHLRLLWLVAPACLGGGHGLRQAGAARWASRSRAILLAGRLLLRMPRLP